MHEAGLAEHFQMLAKYNTIVNQHLYNACSELSDDDLHRDRPGSFRSIHKTLNHILLSDRIWMGRFTRAAVSGTPPLDTILYTDFRELQLARAAEDEGIESFMRSLDDELLRRDLTYVNSRGASCTYPAALTLAHFFNHQTHHRGQIHVMLSQTSIQPLSFDILRVIPLSV